MLEYVVRPFQSPGALGTVVIPSTPTASRQRATITWSAESTLPNVDFAQGTAVNCCKEKHDETKRDSTTQRIFSDDGQSFIDVDRADKLYIKKNAQNSCTDTGASDSVALSEINFEPDGSFDVPKAEKCSIVLTLKN